MQLSGGLGPDRNSIRHPKPDDGIQNGKAGIGFGRLGIEAMVFQAKLRCFGEATPMITTLLLPRLVSVLLSPLQDTRARMGLVFSPGWFAWRFCTA